MFIEGFVDKKKTASMSMNLFIHKVACTALQLTLFLATGSLSISCTIDPNIFSTIISIISYWVRP